MAGPIDRAELRPVTTWSEAEMMRLIRNECREWMTNNQDYINPLDQFRWWRRIAQDPTIRPYLLWLGSRPIGYGLVRRDSEDRWLVTGGLAANYRGLGYGRALFSGLTKVVSDLGHPAFLEVLRTNTVARHLYTSLGYQFTGWARKGVMTMRADWR